MSKALLKLYTRTQNRLIVPEEGATMVEYGLMVVGIAVVVGVAAAALGGRVVALFNGVDVTP